MNDRFNKNDLRREKEIKFQAYGVKIAISAKKTDYLEEIYRLLEKVFPNGLRKVEDQKIEHRFLIASENGDNFDLYQNEEIVFENVAGNFFFETLESRIRVTIAEFAVEKVFLHAGVVGWKGSAIVIPGRSYSGKTTLVAELVKKGAVYYSDEYAILDSRGYVEPFPKWLSLRGIIDDYTQLDCSVESLGGIAGTKAIPVGMVLIARFERGRKTPKRWNRERLSGGQGIMEIIPHTLPMINKPRDVLTVLNKMVSRAIIVRTIRGEAAQFAETLLNYFESETD